MCPWRAGPGAPREARRSWLPAGGAGSRVLGPHWAEGQVFGGWTCGGGRRLELWGPLPFGAPFGSPQEQDRACPRPPQMGPGAALRWVLLCGAFRPQAGWSPFVCSGCVFPLPPREGAASQRSRSRPRVDRRGLGRSAPWRLRAAPGVPSSTTPAAPGASWAGPAALYPDWFGARGRRSQWEAGGLGLCCRGPCPGTP